MCYIVFQATQVHKILVYFHLFIIDTNICIIYINTIEKFFKESVVSWFLKVFAVLFACYELLCTFIFALNNHEV